MKQRLVLFAIALTIFPFTTSAQDIHFENVPGFADEVLNSILSMSQDKNGFLWFGTSGAGLFKYDGFKYINYRVKSGDTNSISSDQIECIAADKDGYIWIGHYHGSSGLERFDPTTGIFTHFHHHANDPNSLSSDTINAIMQDHEGAIWLATVQGLDKYDPKAKRFYHYHHIEGDPGSLSSNQVRIIYEDKKGTIWVGAGNCWLSENPQKEGGLNKLNKITGKFTRYLHKENDPNSLVDDRVGAIFEDTYGNFWVGTAGDGLHTMDREHGTFIRHKFDLKNPAALSRPPLQYYSSGVDDNIRFFTEDNKGRIWIGTYQGGINVYDPATKTISYYGPGKGSKEKLEINFYWYAYKTKDDIIWISTLNSTFYKINPYQQNKLPHTHIASSRVNHLIEDKGQGIWAATNNGLFHVDNKGTTQKFEIVKDSVSNSNIISFIEKDDNGRLWLGAFHGLYYFDPALNKIIPYAVGNIDPGDSLTDNISDSRRKYAVKSANPDDSLTDNIYWIRKTKDGKLWLATLGGGLKALDLKTGKTLTYKHDPKDSGSISNDVVRSVVAENNESIWIGTASGLDKLDKRTGRVKHYLQRTDVFEIQNDSEGNLWASTFRGLFLYDRGADIFKPFVDPAGILTSSTQVFGIAEDHQHGLVVNMSKGIVWINKEKTESRLFGRTQGVFAQNTSNLLTTLQNGNVVVGDTAGYISLSTSSFADDQSHPVANVSSFMLNDLPVEPSPNGILSSALTDSAKIRLKHDQNTFSFVFSSVDFVSDHEDTRLQYMLQNYDKNWRTSRESMEVYYFNVPPGEYIFKVRAYGANGHFDEKQIPVSITPPWWTTWWAYTLFGLCLVAGVFVTDRIRRKYVVEKEREKARKKELAQAREIERAYNELKTTQGQLIQSEKMASLGELTAGIAHEIQNPLNFVNNFSEVNEELLSEMKEEMEKGNLMDAKLVLNNIMDNEKKIIHHGKRADAIVKGMLLHAQSTPGHKELADINALADEYLRLSYHGLRAKDKEFNATVKTDFDPSIGKIKIIPQDIGRVLLNLNNNAFYAVTEKKKEDPVGYEPTVSVSTSRVNGRVEIRVRDNGKGIPEKIKEKIFQPFFTTKPAGQGTGLGLSLSYDIVRAHGGEISVNNKDGQGTEFVVQLPV